MVGSSKGARPGIEARGQFDALMESVLPRGDVTFETDTLGGVPGLWVHPAYWRSGEAIIHLHGGWFNLAPPKHTVTLSGILQREREQVRLSGLSACSRISISGCYRRRTGMLPGTRREGRSPDCSYRGLRWRQSGTRTRVACDRRSRLYQRDSCRSCRLVAGYRPDSFGRDLRDARGCRSPFYSPAGCGTRAFLLRERRRETSTGFAPSRSTLRHAFHSHSRR